MIIDLEKIASIQCLSQKISMQKNQVQQAVTLRKKELHCLGFGKGKTALLLCGNNLSFFIDLFSIWEMNGRCLVVNKSVNKNLIQDILKYYNVDIVVEKCGSVEQITSSLQKISFSGSLLLLSSGTSGYPKIVELSEERIKDRFIFIQTMIGRDVGRGLVFLPTSFGHGLIANSLSLLVANRELVISREFDVELALNLKDILRNSGIDFFSTVPTHFEVLHKVTRQALAETKRLEIHCASAALSKGTFSKAAKMFSNSTFKYHYGMTELGSWITQKVIEDVASFEPSNVGKPYGLGLQIGKSSHQLLIKNDIDEMITHDLTKRKKEVVPRGKFFDTQDVVSLEEDEIFIKGRLGDFINKAGVKISPLEIESAIESLCLDQKYMVVPITSEFYGEEIAIVFFETDKSSQREHEIQTHCVAKLGSVKAPKYFFYFKEYPVTSNGKVSRKQIAEEIAELRKEK